MSIWLLIGCALLGWTVVSVAFAFWLGRLLSERRLGGTVDFTLTDFTPIGPAIASSSSGFKGGSDMLERIRDYTEPEDKSAA